MSELEQDEDGFIVMPKIRNEQVEKSVDDYDLAKYEEEE